MERYSLIQTQFFLSFENDPIEHWKLLNINSNDELLSKQNEVQRMAYQMFLNTDRKWLGNHVPSVIVRRVVTEQLQKFSMEIIEK